MVNLSHQHPDQHMVQTPDASLQAFIHGQGPFVMILPSLGRGVEDMFEFSSLLAAEGFRVCLLNPRGIGASEGNLEPLSLNHLADDVAHVIEKMSPSQAHVAGHAFGNWVARNLATRRPDLVKSVALVGAAHKHFPLELRQQIDICMDATRNTDIRIQALKTAFFASCNDPSSWLEGWHPEVAMAQRRASAACPKAEWWHAGNVPLLDLQGEEDPFAPLATAYELQDELGKDRVSVHRIPNASHALIPEKPMEVSRILADFFKQ
jgi:pimeloyl-ACP methyl ester carboxylesterase